MNSIPRLCSVEGCDGTLKSRGYCNMHYRRWLKHGDVTFTRKVRGECAVDGCKKLVAAKGWCKTHYYKWRRNGDPNIDKSKVRETCRLDGCTNPRKGLGYCGLHYNRLKSSGSVYSGKCKVSDCNEQRKVGRRTYCAQHLEIARDYTNKSSEYIAWCNMRSRCYNHKYEHFEHYGGRGIIVDQRWRDCFLNFLFDMGEKPGPEYSLDRVKVNKNYTSDNCRWTTQTIQSINTRSRKDNTSGYRGVSRHGNCWSAHISTGGKNIYLGTYPSKVEAAMSYNAAALKYHGQDAKLNDV